MTLIGFNLCRDGTGLMWADGEAYRTAVHELSVPIDADVTKLAVSSGGLVGCSTGYLDLSQRFREMVERFGDRTFDDAVARLPLMLRAEHAIKRTRMRGVELAYEAHSTYLLSGWAGGVACCAVFSEARDFEPFEVDGWLSPHVEAGAPQSAAEVADVAMEQLRTIRRAVCLDATGRMLTIARIGPERTVKVSVPLVVRDDEIESTNFWRGGRVGEAPRRAGKS
jgi:hypothetical protein